MSIPTFSLVAITGCLVELTPYTHFIFTFFLIAQDGWSLHSFYTRFRFELGWHASSNYQVQAFHRRENGYYFPAGKL